MDKILQLDPKIPYLDRQYEHDMEDSYESGYLKHSKKSGFGFLAFYSFIYSY